MTTPVDPFTRIQRALADTLASDPQIAAMLGAGGLVRYDNPSGTEERPEQESLLDADGPVLDVEQGPTTFNSVVTSSSFAFEHTLRITTISFQEMTPQINRLRWLIYTAIERARRRGRTEPPSIFGLSMVRTVRLATPSQESVGVYKPETGEAIPRGRVCVMEVQVGAHFSVAEELA